MKKRLIAIIIALSMAASLVPLSGCKEKGSAAEPLIDEEWVSWNKTAAPNQNAESDERKATTLAVELNNTYTTRFEEVNAVTYPPFVFDYPNGWTVSKENVTPEAELVTLTNDRGARITYSYIGIKNPGGNSAVLMEQIDVSKVADANFVPGSVQATDYSDLGKFMVAKLKVIGSLDMTADSEYSEVDGGVSYAVLPETYIGVHSGIRDLSFLIDFSFWYAGNVALIATAPEDGFTEQEEKEVIAVLSSFRVKP